MISSSGAGMTKLLDSQQSAKSSIADPSRFLVANKRIVRSCAGPGFRFLNRRLLAKNEIKQVIEGGYVFLKDADDVWSVAVYMPEIKSINSFQADSDLVAMIDAQLVRQAMASRIGAELTAPAEAVAFEPVRRRYFTGV